MTQDVHNLMTHPSLIRRAPRWIGVGFCLVLVAAWIVTWWGTLTYNNRAGITVSLGRGSVMLTDTAGSPVMRNMLRRYPPSGRVASTHWTWIKHSERYFVWRPSRSTIWMLGTVVFIPLWIPLLTVALPTAILFGFSPMRRRYRRRRASCVHCGYDLRRNVSGVCPECGSSA